MDRNSLMFDTSAPGPAGVVADVSPLTRRLIAPNPGAFTFSGTCSYLVGRRRVAIIDPGPAIPAHVEALLRAVSGQELVAILVTHTHRDHSPAAAILREKTGAPILGCGPYVPRSNGIAAGSGLDASHDFVYAPDRALNDGELVRVGEVSIEAVATPGHTANHLCFALHEEGVVFTGDHVMAWSTTVVAPPDGSMRDYMESIEKLRRRADVLLWPGHGGPVREPQRYLRAIAHHRRQREAAILQRLDEGDETIPQMVARIYEGVNPRLHGAAALTILAHMEDLIARGAVEPKGPVDILQGRFVKVV
ncbi:MBL fold metallo-hydrolase [Methylocystis heyeri]|uniref:MBL fold metallo-hydrolase n=2 Tax=Methylocystis heyeri TaxID=391905 RepID=A0A6B8KBY1_9HYPH|nr:MBL fold metallo-hydrolase [Methylocystis heyeri]